MEQTLEAGGANGTSQVNSGASTDNVMPRFIFMPTQSSDAEQKSNGREDPSEEPAGRPPSVARQVRFVAAPADAPPVDALPAHGVACFRQMLSEYETFAVNGDDPDVCLHPNPQAFSAIDSLFIKPYQMLTWDDLDRLEMARLQVLPPATLRAQSWLIRERYAEAVGPEQFRRYLAARPGDWCDAAVPAEILRADLETLLSETQKTRILRPGTATSPPALARAQARWTLGLCLSGIFVFVVTRFLPLPGEIAPVIPLLLAMLGGAVGGLVGLPDPRRESTPPRLSRRDTTERDWRHSILLSPIKAAVFAAALYFVFLGGSHRGGFFPRVDAASLSVPANFAGLMVWSFATGLAVCLLPRASQFARDRKRTKAEGATA